MKTKPAFLRLFAFVLTMSLMLTAAAAGTAETADRAELAEGSDIRVMSFNVMHDEWSKVALTGRDQTAVSLLLHYMPDVVGLQEAGTRWHRALKPLLVDTGIYTPACRQSNAEGFKFCTTTFLYNPQTVQLMDEYVLDLDKANATRVFSVAVFKKISTGAQFVVANTHPSPTTEPEKYERNFADLISYANAEMDKYAGLPVIVLGDFNTAEQSDVYAGFLEATGLKNAKHEAETVVREHSTYIEWQAEAGSDEVFCIDHIFVNDKNDVRLYNVITGHDIRTISDHFPIYADIALK